MSWYERKENHANVCSFESVNIQCFIWTFTKMIHCQSDNQLTFCWLTNHFNTKSSVFHVILIFISEVLPLSIRYGSTRAFHWLTKVCFNPTSPLSLPPKKSSVTSLKTQFTKLVKPHHMLHKPVWSGLHDVSLSLAQVRATPAPNMPAVCCASELDQHV